MHTLTEFPRQVKRLSHKRAILRACFHLPVDNSFLHLPESVRLSAWYRHTNRSETRYAVSQVDHIINAMGGPTKSTRRLQRLTNVPIGLSTIQSWRSNVNGIPPLWRFVLRSNADRLGLNEPSMLAYLQPEDDI